MQSLRNLYCDLLRRLPDALFLRLLYFKYHKRWLNLRHPRRYTEFAQWLKLYGGLERYTMLADKYAVREYVGKVAGPQYLIPLIGVYDRFDEIPLRRLPKRFVLKANHGCEYNVICKDKATFDVAGTRAKFYRWLNENFYTFEREPQYKHITPRILCEEYLEDDTGGLRDYKIFCVNGRPKLIQVDTDRFIGHKLEMFTTRWRKITTTRNGTYHEPAVSSPKPAQLKEMLEVARRLSAGMPFVRVDLYLANDQIYFGELTFTHGSGIITFTPKKTGDEEFARLLGLTTDLLTPADTDLPQHGLGARILAGLNAARLALAGTRLR